MARWSVPVSRRPSEGKRAQPVAPPNRDASEAIAASGLVERGWDAQPEQSPLMFDPWLTSSHRAVTVIGDNILAAYERVAPPRQRRMKDRDRENLQAIVRTILANLAYAVAIRA